MFNLGATEDQLDFKTIYGSAKQGWMSRDWKQPTNDITALLDTILEEIPAPAVVEVVFKNSAGFSIGMNLILIPASVSTLGSGPAAGVDAHIDGESDGTLWRRAVVNNAAYDYIARCESSDLDIKAPPQDLRIWIFKDLTCGSAPMLHHGAFIEGNGLLQKYLGGYMSLLKVFLPDITIGAKTGDGAFADLYSAVMHEMAHASHYAQVGNNWWTPFITYVIRSYVTEGKQAYAPSRPTTISGSWTNSTVSSGTSRRSRSANSSPGPPATGLSSWPSRSSAPWNRGSARDSLPSTISTRTAA